MPPRDTQLLQVKFLMNVLSHTDVKVSLVQMQVGSGKNYVESFLARSILDVFEDFMVIIIHATKEISDQSYRTYGKIDPLCGQFGRNGSYSG